MSPRKLTEADKKEILTLYRLPQETTSTLAERFEVSSSTISRFLKNRLPEGEYEELIQQKRLSRTPTGAAHVLSQYEQQQDQDDDLDFAPSNMDLELSLKPKEESESSEENGTGTRRTRRRSSAPVFAEKTTTRTLPPTPVAPSTPLAEALFELEKEEEEAEVHALEEMLGEDIGVLDEDLDEDDFDEDDDWEDLEEDSPPILPRKLVSVKVLPLSEATFPRTCYLVIDRSSELITRPLREFSDLGAIPSEEYQQKTLPVFDNHRVARRFSNRSQRVIKVPDSRLFQKTQSYLEAKGITRLLLDGQVYSLLNSQN